MGRVWEEMYRYKVMNDVEKKEAAERMKKGDEAAREALIVTNFRFVADRAGRFAGIGIEKDDLIAVGCNALSRYIDQYDPEKGELTTCMAPYIVGAMKDELNRNGRLIRLPKKVIAALSKIRVAEKELMEELGRPATAGEIAERMGCTVKKVQQMKAVTTGHVSLNDPISEDNPRTHEEVLLKECDVEAYDDATRKSDIACVRKCFAKLDDRDRNILKRSVIKREKLRIIALEMGVSRQYVDQLRTRALNRLKKIIEKNYPDLLAA